MKFAIYFREDNLGSELIGSDSIFPLDGRYSIKHCLEVARLNVKTKQYLRENAKYVRIAKGTVLNPIYITLFKEV